MKTIMYVSLAVLSAAGLIGASGTMASAFQSECLQDANTEFLECRTICQEEVQAARDQCRNIPHECADACRDTRDACVDGAIDELDTCLTPCNDALVIAKEDCRILHTGDPTAVDQCIDLAQLTAFACRDDCRESIHVAYAMKQCGRVFRSCLKNCLNPAP